MYRIFEELVKYCQNTKGSIQISFLLGFFVSGVIARWYQMFILIPWLNKISFTMMGGINPMDNNMPKQVRLTLMRYLNLAWILGMGQISDQIAGRFAPKPSTTNSTSKKNKPSTISDPQHASESQWLRDGLENPTIDTDKETIRDTLMALNDDPIVQGTYKKLITESEIKAFEKIAHSSYAKSRVPYILEYWVPLAWAVRVIQKAAIHNLISDAKLSFALIEEINKFRQQLQDLTIYSSIMIPLVYTQVVIIATYSYFLCEVFSTQFVKSHDDAKKTMDFYFPLFSIFSFIFYMGWLKVVMCVMNPFGDDDEDFQTSTILDYNLTTSYRCVTMEEHNYPKGLGPPIGPTPAGTDTHQDNLPQYLTTTDIEFSSVVVPDSLGNFHDLEYKQSIGSKCYDCTHRQRRDE
ncbi:hypothetical protein Ciccas_005962 [Cichlidogyrus casuarinus]|uniref:Bestrophin homolog n=1 Tax=Cichlidogyrus casuarinus TaxID=1844966 RepID=A0ABD2Q760_9PLAT